MVKWTHNDISYYYFIILHTKVVSIDVNEPVHSDQPSLLGFEWIMIDIAFGKFFCKNSFTKTYLLVKILVRVQPSDWTCCSFGLKFASNKLNHFADMDHAIQILLLNSKYFDTLGLIYFDHKYYLIK